LTDFYGDESLSEAKKFCPGCGRTLPLSEFYRDRRAAMKVRSRCKHCLALQEVARREDNKERRPVTTRERERQKKARWRKRHPDKVQAYAKLRYWEIKRRKFEKMLGKSNESKQSKSL